MYLRNILFVVVLSCWNTCFSQGFTDSLINQWRDTGKAKGSEKYYLIETDPGVSQDWINRLSLTAIRKPAKNLFIIDGTSVKEDLLANQHVRRIYSINDDWKLSPAVSTIKRSGIDNHRKIRPFNILLRDTNTDDFFLKYPSIKMSAKVLPQQNIISVKINYQQLERLFLHDNSVVFIDLGTAKPSEELGTPGYDLSVNKISMAHSEYPDINGAGQHVSIKEDKYDTSDIDLKGRLEYSPLASANISNHANFMATIIAGAGNSVHYARGAAWGASISSSSFEQIFPERDDYYLQKNISVENHSYGTVAENEYGLSAMAFDKSANNNEGLLHVFSSGNNGTNTNTGGNYAGLTGYANLTGNFKMAKNILTVGAIDSFGNVSPLSSKGPAYDGRIKPELVAFQKNGTSEAAALVSGVGLLLQQYYRVRNTGDTLSSTLAKAILINTADDVDAAGPDFKSGFGNMNAKKALDVVRDNSTFSGDIEQGALQIFNVTIPEKVAALKITLAWNDPAALPLAPQALVNDLDLELAFPSSQSNWKPWVLNPIANVDSLKSLAVRKRDSLNNVEQITLENPLHGNYQIKVTGYNLLSSHQKFDVVYSWDSSDYFKWQTPDNNDVVEAGSRSVLRWQNSFNSTGRCEYAIIPSNEWQLVSSSTDLHMNYAYWQVPDTNSQAVLRMKLGDKYFYSDTIVITSLANPTTGYICGDSIMIYWNKLKNISRYQLYQLGARYMEPLVSVGDTTVVISKNILKDRYIAVGPILDNGTRGHKSYAFNYTVQGSGCFINSFYADKSGNSARLNLSLGTLTNVVSIGFEKQTVNGYSDLQSLMTTNGLQYMYEYGPLMPGITYFRARVTLSDGQVIYSDREAVFYAPPGKYVLLPIPVNKKNDMTIISELPNGELFSVIDVLGRVVLQQEIRYTREIIRTSSLQSGQYFYSIIKNGIKMTSGKIVIL